MNEIQQEIPQAPEIETAVLGVLLTDHNCIPENLDKILAVATTTLQHSKKEIALSVDSNPDFMIPTTG